MFEPGSIQNCHKWICKSTRTTHESCSLSQQAAETQSRDQTIILINRVPLLRSERIHLRCFLILRHPLPLVGGAEMSLLGIAVVRNAFESTLIHKNPKQSEDLEDDRTGSAETGSTLRHLESKYIEVGLDSYNASW